MFKRILSEDKNRTQRVGLVLIVSLITIIGIYLLTYGHAAGPYASVHADSGKVANGANIQTCNATTDGDCVVFNGVTTPYTGSIANSLAVYNTSGDNYYYAGERQFATASGVSVTLSQAQPQVAQSAGAENHSVMETTAESSDGKQIVEEGWIVDPILNGDSLPHLFVFYWVNGVPSACYNTCGFIKTSSTFAPGNAVAVNTTGNYSINYTNNGWYVYYNGTQLGYFPESLWGGSYTQLTFTETFGEVEIGDNSSSQCVQMGNGVAGNTVGSATISNFSLIGSSTAVALSPYATVPSTYSYGFPSANGTNIGGPGSC